MGKSLRSKGQQRNRAIMREKVFGPAREKVELSIAKRLHGEEVLRKKEQEKADKEDAMETEDAPAGEEADKPKVSTGGFSKKKKKARKLKSNNITFNTKRKKKN
ncbi:hypothetical protein B0I72DRAFT_154861 [Yarrowia lipolytica]|uniref:DUF2423 domain-containing protein n=1 Tax=Yarrowia lipolytica TaxID=4952 RepID=A0A1D8NJZ6_YARLL|nr:hypothetical protein YALI1_E29939g [Yarrowia lipolytica]KAB8285865.1 hypothetical protein BKA91DRAFT_143492 [Yarrowia lipolytica]KAE8171752.1 hypothetical protein BKA90DRAFT_147223 [Yarrowia lipolytica]KAJ8057355.1 hypothetical protein LXG23DRAFT_34235 [Yarrowia lipolytica]QNP99186.1 Hypothetical protein YALI2_E00502g [Yarrowia lipolytica]